MFFICINKKKKYDICVLDHKSTKFFACFTNLFETGLLFQDVIPSNRCFDIFCALLPLRLSQGLNSSSRCLDLIFLKEKKQNENNLHVSAHLCSFLWTSSQSLMLLLLSFQPKMCASVLQLAFRDLVKFKQTKPPGFSMYYRKNVNQAEYIFPLHSCRNPQD